MGKKYLVRTLTKNKANNQYSITLPKKMFVASRIQTKEGVRKTYLEPRAIKIMVEKLVW